MEQAIECVNGDDEGLREVVFKDGSRLPSKAMFFNTTRRQSTQFAKMLGCEEYDDKGCDLNNKAGKTSIPGLYVVGDASKDFLQVIVAAAEGTEAAISINKELMVDSGVLPAQE